MRISLKDVIILFYICLIMVEFFIQKDRIRHVFTYVLPAMVMNVTDNNTLPLPPCSNDSDLLEGASVKPNTTSPTWQEVEQSVQNVQNGGLYTPPNCSALQSVVLVIPYRNREEHLRTLLRHMHPFLQRQQARYAILVVEETKTPLFNKGIAMNIGFLEAMKRFNPDCVIIHDVDQLPKDDRNTYRCEEKAVHLGVILSQLGPRLLYKTFFGGVIAVTPEQFLAGNGFSTEFYGWGQEDDDMLYRLLAVGVGFTRRDKKYTAYSSLRHDRDLEFIENPNNDNLLKTRNKYRKSLEPLTEGLNSTRYKVTKTIVYPLYTYIRAEAETPLMNYSHATNAIPCVHSFTYQASLSLVECAAMCTTDGAACKGFVYRFAKKYKCYLKRTICRTTETLHEYRFFRKIV